MKAVPRFENLAGFFDFKDVRTVADEVVEEVVGTMNAPDGGDPVSRIRFRHHNSEHKVPVQEFGVYMEGVYGGRFETVGMHEWLARATEMGIEDLIVSYLDAIVGRRDVISFPFMGERI